MSSTHKRATRFYPTPQNQFRLEKVVTGPDGLKKQGASKNKIINKALVEFFERNPRYAV